MPERTGLRRALYVLLIGVAGGLLWWGYSLRAEPVDPTLVDAAVEDLVPANGSPGVLRQSQITIDLAPTWTGVLQVNGVEIPEDQLIREPAQNKVTFLPGPGQEIERLPAGPVVVQAIIWRPLEGETRDDGARTVTWTFRVA